MAKKRAKINIAKSQRQNVLFTPTEQPRQVKSDRNSTSKARQEARATYEIGPELKGILKEESVRLGVPASQLAKYLLLYAWDMYCDDEIPAPTLLPSHSPAFRNNIEF